MLLRCQSSFSCVGNVWECDREVLKVSSTCSVYFMNSKHTSGGLKSRCACVAHRGVTSGLCRGWSTGCWRQRTASVRPSSVLLPLLLSVSSFSLSSFFLFFFPLLALPFLLALLVFLPHQLKKHWTKHLGTNLKSPEKLKLLKRHVYAPVPSEFNIDLTYFAYNFNVCIIKFYFVLLSLHHVGIFIFLDHAHNCNSPCIIVKQHNSPLSAHTSLLSHFF